MEIKINKEIRDYKENIFFGLSLRQFICSILAIVSIVFSICFSDISTAHSSDAARSPRYCKD